MLLINKLINNICQFNDILTKYYNKNYEEISVKHSITNKDEEFF